ncbi:hypothetical protein DPMN_079073 [Dreissena polymorpha]|uniref:Uncharacterized protein n=1 Tax=Dreissena polymorpha TaxID=45954 RepID=A0A9D3YRL6_DREPO|nr:hypothetical protein DPMN_079073 [Dreissena polymorpha]
MEEGGLTILVCVEVMLLYQISESLVSVIGWLPRQGGVEISTDEECMSVAVFLQQLLDF